MDVFPSKETRKVIFFHLVWPARQFSYADEEVVGSVNLVEQWVNGANISLALSTAKRASSVVKIIKKSSGMKSNIKTLWLLEWTKTVLTAVKAHQRK